MIYDNKLIQELFEDQVQTEIENIDGFIEICGNRINPLDIKEILYKNNLTVDCAVTVRKRGNGQPYLTIFCVLKQEVFLEQVGDCLNKYLPQHFLPIGAASISAIPYNANGSQNIEYLESIKLLDTIQVEAIEKELKETHNTDVSGIKVKEKVENSGRLYIKDFLSGKYTNNKDGTEATEAIKGDTTSNGQNEVEPFAIINGPDIKIEPGEPKTLADILQRAVELNSDKGIIYINSNGKRAFRTYSYLLNCSEKILSGLRSSGIKPGDKVILLLDNQEEYISAFWGCILGGIVPVPITVPKSFKEQNNEINMVYNIWETLDRCNILSNEEIKDCISSTIKYYNFNCSKIIVVDTLSSYEPDHKWHISSPDDTALLLFTSGSTGKPKGVIQTHKSILARERGTVLMNRFNSNDISLNWMPLEHVGGIVMFHIRDVYAGCLQIHVKTEYILNDPLRWIDLVSEYQSTITWAPNFAFALVNERLKARANRTWDLSKMKFILNGGEAINANTAKKFINLLGEYGLSSNSMKPSWGMSETCSGVIYSHKLTGESDTGIHCIDKYSLSNTIRTSTSETNKVTFVELGKPIAGVSVRIVDNNNSLLREHKVGRLQIKGPNVTIGYYNNQELNNEAFTEDGWFDTGDLGFIKQKCLTITGRAKDVIIINGININSVEVEAIVEEVDGVETSYTAACAIREENGSTDNLVIFYSSQNDDTESKITQIKEIYKRLANKMGIKVDKVIPLAKEEILKTSIGKIQKAKLCKALEEGCFDNIIREIDLGLENEKTLPSWFFRRSWYERGNILQDKIQNRRFIIFEDDIGLGRQVACRLKEEGLECIRVSMGKEFAKLETNYYSINYKSSDDYKCLFDDISKDNMKSLSIFHLYSYNGQVEDQESIEEIKDIQHKGLYSLMCIIQALNCFTNKDVDIFVVGSNTQLVSQNDCITYAKGSVLGYIKSISLEFSWLKLYHIDLEMDCKDNVNYIIRELKNTTKNTEVAYRKGRRMLPYIIQVNIKDEIQIRTPIRRGGVYLVTGGLGGIGSNISRRLLKEYGVKLIIVGRTKLPERDECINFVNTNTTIAKRIRAYLDIESVGGEFIYESGDICDEEFLMKVINSAKERWKQELAGIIHLAGNMENVDQHWRDIDRHWAVNETLESYESMFYAKVYGCIKLHQLIKDNKNIDFIVFSSAMSLFGAASFSAYSSANSFTDSFCAYRINKGYRNTYCLGWSMWDNIGMSEDTCDAALNSMKANGFESISADDGFSSMLISLKCSTGQMIVGLNANNEKIWRNLIRYPTQKQVVKVYVRTEDEAHKKEMYYKNLVSKILLNKFHIDNAEVEIRYLDFHQLNDEKSGINMLNAEGIKYGYYETGSTLTEVEKKLARVWKDILGKPVIDKKDNFFELGGHSLKATRLVASINKVFDFEVPISQIFRNPTIEELASYIENMQKKNYIPIGQAEKREFYPVSSAQKRMHILSQWDSNNAYNIPYINFIQGKFDISRAEKAFNTLIKRHEALRTSFNVIDGEIVQLIHDDFDFKAQYFEGSESEIEFLVQQFIRPFDLTKCPLLRVAFARLSEEKYLLMYDLHHIIFDGLSLAIFTKEFEELYEGNNTLTDIKVQYKDFSVWQNDLYKTDFLKKQEKYWLNVFDDKILVLNFPTDYPRPKIQSYDGDTVSCALNKELTMKINEIAIKTGTTNYMVLLAMFNILLQKYTGQEDIIVGTGVAGRSHADLENTIGMFVNMLAMRNHPLKSLSFLEFLDKVKENSLGAFENQDYPFEELIEKLNITRDLSRNPLFDVAFAMQNIEKKNINLKDLNITTNYMGTNVAKFDLALQVAENDDEIMFMMEYCTRLFTKETIEILLEDYIKIIRFIVDDINVKIGDIDLKSRNLQYENALLEDLEFDFN